MHRLTLAACVALVACDDGREAAEVPVVRPAAVRSETRPVEALDVAASADLRAVATADGLTVVGSRHGLYTLDAGGVAARVDARPVVALAALASGGALVAMSDGLFVYDGATLEESPLEVAPVRALATRGVDVWVATADEVLAIGPTTLDRFALGGVREIIASAGAGMVVLRGDAVHVLRATGEGGWAQRAGGDEPATVLTPAADGLFGLVDGVLSLRQDEADGAAWRPVALTDDPQDAGAHAQALAVDPASGALWVLTAAALVRVVGDERAHLERPDAPASPRLAVDQAGALWLFEDDGVTRLPAEVRPDAPTWEDDIEPFAEANCVRCHGDIGTAPPMHTFDHWVERAERIVARLDAGDMPADRQPLVGGDVRLVRAWLNGGLQP